MQKAFRNYNFIKGSLAEAIVERLFLTLGFDVHPYGIEKKIPSNLRRLHYGGQMKMRVFTRSENDPDFIVYREAGWPRMLMGWPVEVKFRTDGKIRLEELDKYRQHDVLFLLLDTTNIYCLPSNEMERFRANRSGRGEVAFKDCLKLWRHPVFGFTSEERRTIRHFSALVQATLGQCNTQENVKQSMAAVAAPGLCQQHFNKL